MLQEMKRKKGPSYTRDSRLNVINNATNDYENMTLLHSPDSDDEEKEGFKTTLVKRPESLMKLESQDTETEQSFGYKHKNCKWSRKTRLKIVYECPPELLKSVYEKKPESPKIKEKGKPENTKNDNTPKNTLCNGNSQSTPSFTGSLTQKSTTSTESTNHVTATTTPTTPPPRISKVEGEVNVGTPISSKLKELPETPLAAKTFNSPTPLTPSTANTILFPKRVVTTNSAGIATTVSVVKSDLLSYSKSILTVNNQPSVGSNPTTNNKSLVNSMLQLPKPNISTIASNIVNNKIVSKTTIIGNQAVGASSLRIPTPLTSLLSASPASIISGNTPLPNKMTGIPQPPSANPLTATPVTAPSFPGGSLTSPTPIGSETKPKVVKLTTKVPISGITDPQRLLQILNGGNPMAIMKALEAAGIKAPAGKMLAIRTSAGNFVLKSGDKNINSAPTTPSPAAGLPLVLPKTPITTTTSISSGSPATIKITKPPQPATPQSAAVAAFSKNLNLQKDFLSRAERKIKSMHLPYKTAPSLLETETRRLSKQRVGIKRLFTLQKHPLRRLARGNFFKEVAGFKYQPISTKGTAPWPKAVPRPTFHMAWRYFVGKAKRYTSIAHMLRLLHACIDWETVNDQPVKGIKRVITSNKGIYFCCCAYPINFDYRIDNNI